MILLTIISLLLLIGLMIACIMRGRWVLFFGIALMLFGIGAMYSVSIYESFQLTLDHVNSGLLDDTSNYFYFYGQIQKLGLGFAICLVLYLIPRTTLKKYPLVYFGMGAFLMLLLFTPLGRDYDKGAKLWLEFFNAFTIQPGEFYKIGTVFFLVSRLLRKRKILQGAGLFLGYAVILFLLLAIFFVIGDFGSLMIMCPVALMLYWYMTGERKHVTIVCAAGLLGVLGVYGIVTSDRMTSIPDTQKSYIHKRVEFFFGAGAANADQNIGRQTENALIAIGGGGRVGKGYGKGLQKFGYIPEAQSDFIFAAFAEEIGFIGSVVLLFLYFMLMYSTVVHLPSIRSDEDRGLVVGLISLLMFQTCINLGVNMNILPLTGVTLPFISHGGSALRSSMMQLMLIHKIVYKV